MGQGRNVKRMVQLLLSISLVSFLISISSWVCFGYQALRFCVVTLPVQLISHSINRNCIFLVCNGLLVFIANSSGLIPAGAYVSQPASSCSLTSHPSNKGRTTIIFERNEEEEKHEEEERNYAKTSTPAMVDKEVVMVQYGDDSSFKKWLLDSVEMENGVIHDMKELSMDDVNRRFDEFIWKTKEEIRLETLNQLQLDMDDALCLQVVK